MENEINKSVDVILEKKLESYYSSDHKNFIAKGEATVTITLSEYRELLTATAKSEYKVDSAEKKTKEAEKECEALKAEIRELKNEIATLNSELYKLSKPKCVASGEEK